MGFNSAFKGLNC